MDSINEMDDKFADAAKKSIAAAKEYQAYLNYEDVQKELEEAKDIMKELIHIADRYEPIPEYPNDKAIIDRAKQFLT